jgi:hypothetical protein
MTLRSCWSGAAATEEAQLAAVLRVVAQFEVVQQSEVVSSVAVRSCAGEPS